MIDQTVAEAPRHLGLQPLDLFRLELDHLAGAKIDEMVVMAFGHLLVARATVAEVVALDDPGVLEQLHRAVDGGDRNAVVYRGATPIRSEEHTSELQSLRHLVCRLLLEKKKTK